MNRISWQPLRTGNPWNNVNTLRNRMNMMFDDMVDRQEDTEAITWAPNIDMIEFEDHYVLTIEVPGVPKDKINIDLKESVLTIAGQKASEYEDNKNLLIGERGYGKFRRKFHIPSNIDEGKIEANFMNGLLNIKLPKREEAKPRSIQIS